MDIVLEEDGQKTGFLAETVEEYAEAILEIVKMNETERLKMAESARKRAARFSEQRFCEDFKTAIRPIFTGPLKWQFLNPQNLLTALAFKRTRQARLYLLSSLYRFFFLILVKGLT